MASFSINITGAPSGLSWQVAFGKEPGKDNNAETDQVISVVKNLASALTALEPVTSEPA